MKLRELFNITINPGFKNIKGYISYSEEIEIEKQNNKERKKGRKTKNVKRRFGSLLSQYEKLNKYIKDCYYTAECYLKFNDEFNLHEEKKIWSSCSLRDQRVFSNFLLNIEEINSEDKDLIKEKLERLSVNLNSNIFLKDYEEKEIFGKNEENEENEKNEKK